MTGRKNCRLIVVLPLVVAIHVDIGNVRVYIYPWDCMEILNIFSTAIDLAVFFVVVGRSHWIQKQGVSAKEIDSFLSVKALGRIK
jgi:hypothetical protein